MRPLQILINNYLSQKQELEYRLEGEINSKYPSVGTMDNLIEQLTLLDLKNEYLTNILISISNARNTNDISEQPAE